jgi:hypothetical protein
MMSACMTHVAGVTTGAHGAQSKAAPPNDGCGINGSGGTTPPKYTVVYMAEHTCTANDSMELPPVILETATVPAANNNTAAVAGPVAAVDSASSPAAATTTMSATTTGTAQSPATSDVTWSSTANNNKEHAAIIDDLLYDEGLFDVDNARWAERSSRLLVQDDIDYFSGAHHGRQLLDD